MQINKLYTSIFFGLKKTFFFSFLIFIQICFSSILVGAMAAPRYTHGVPNNTDLKKKIIYNN